MICVHICSKAEWNSIKQILDIEQEKINRYPLGEYFQQKLHDTNCIFYHSGATKTRAAAACQYAIDNWKPEIIFVLGTCGGVAHHLKIFDIVIANKTVQYDCIDRMSGDHSMFYEPMTTELDNSWIDFDRLEEKFFQGIIATADQDINYQTLQLLRKADVLCADWESGAIAHICASNKVKCCIVRGITDIPRDDGENSILDQGQDYHKNTPLVMKKIIDTMLPLLTQSAGCVLQMNKSAEFPRGDR